MNPTHPIALGLSLLSMSGLLGCTAPRQSRAIPTLTLPDLPTALRNSPGCLGVELARTTGGQELVFAWFENKQAVETWYDSDIHQQAMRRFFPEAGATRPLRGVPDHAGPILTIVSITFTRDGHVEGTGLPISQLAIELYQPIKAGHYIGKTFAPMGMVVHSALEDERPD